MSMLSHSLLGASAAAAALGISVAAASEPGPNAISGGAPAVARPFTLPSVSGPAAVGRVEIALRDVNRIDPFADDGRTRELAVWIWYPAAAASGAPAAYLPPAWAEAVNNVGPLLQDLTSVGANAIADAPLAGRPPAVVLMPALNQPVSSYSALAEDLASHGYAVIGINPTGSTDVVFPDGHAVATMARGTIPESLLPDISAWYVAAEAITTVWADDAAFVVDALAANPPAIGPLDFTRVAYVGHSLGGAAAFEACSQDASCAAAIDFDGTLWTEVRHSGMRAPGLLLRRAPTGECDAYCVEAEVGFENVLAAGSAQQFAIAGTTHNSFGDLGFMPSPANVEAYRGSIDPGRLIVIVRDVVRSFLDVGFGTAPASTFADATARHPELQ